MKKIIVLISILSLFSAVVLTSYITLKHKLELNTYAGFIPVCDIFENSSEYNNFMINKISFKDISFKIHKIEKGDNFWKISKQNSLNIDTMLAFNPYWNDLLANLNEEILIPSEKGAVIFIDDLDYIDTIKSEYNLNDNDIVIQDLPEYFRYYYKFTSENEKIAVFLKGAKPVIENMTTAMADKYGLREMFRSPLGGRLSSFFGNRIHPIFQKKKFHDGIDIAAPYGTYVGASCEGTIVAAGWMGGYGKAVIIEHRDGYKTLYGHLSKINTRTGRHVKSGQCIGRVGSTGYSTGPHLHFTLWKNGKLLNPLEVLW
ncbi:MAG: M23 family metallopeptidase [Spirochaetes bacterium]|nr:M23 family metallopeptidase [Spirochaetota bacterium]